MNIKMQWTSGCAERSIGISVRTAHTKANGCGIGVGAAHTLGASDVDAVWWDGSDKAAALTCTGDAQRMPDKGRLQCVVDMRQIEAETEGNVSPTLVATDYKGGKAVVETPEGESPDNAVCPTLEANLFNKNTFQGCDKFLIERDGDGQAVCFQQNQRDEVRLMSGDGAVAGAVCAVQATKNQNLIAYENHPNDSRVKEAGDVSPTLTSRLGTGGGNTPMVQELVYGANVECYPLNGMSMITEFKAGDRHPTGIGRPDDPLPTITVNHHHAVTIPQKDVAYQKHMTVRRLLPVETERLMGFPDNWTRIPWRGKPAEQCPDGPRYKACGNSFCVNCMEWIGERIEKVERELQEE